MDNIPAKGKAKKPKARKRRINSCAKGKSNERAFAKLLNSHGVRAWRGAQHAGKGKTGEAAPDVCVPDMNAHIEVKADERLNIHKAMAQAVDDALEDEIPIVAHKKNRTEWLCTLRASDLIEILKAHHSL